MTSLHEFNWSYWHSSLGITQKNYKRGQNKNANVRFQYWSNEMDHNRQCFVFYSLYTKILSTIYLNKFWKTKNYRTLINNEFSSNIEDDLISRESSPLFQITLYNFSSWKIWKLNKKKQQTYTAMILEVLMKLCLNHNYAI